MQGNARIVVDPSGAYTATFNGATQQHYGSIGAKIAVIVTAVSGSTPTLVGKVQYSYDGSSFVDADATNLKTASITAAGTYVLSIYPGLATTANVSKNDTLPRTWRMQYTLGGTSPSFTFSTIVNYIGGGDDND